MAYVSQEMKRELAPAIKAICKKYGIKPIYGVRLFLTESKESRLCHAPHIFLALNDDGLCEIYRLVSKAWSNFHYIPRLTIS